MAGVMPPPRDVTAAEFAALDPNALDVGQRVTLSDDGEIEYEVRGADGAHTWVELHTGHVADHETNYDHDAFLTSVPEAAHAWMPLFSIQNGTPTVVLDDDDGLIPTEIPL